MILSKQMPWYMSGAGISAIDLENKPNEVSCDGVYLFKANTLLDLTNEIGRWFHDGKTLHLVCPNYDNALLHSIEVN
jgi:DNA modification methylase